MRKICLLLTLVVLITCAACSNNTPPTQSNIGSAPSPETEVSIPMPSTNSDMAHVTEPEENVFGSVLTERSRLPHGEYALYDVDLNGTDELLVRFSDSVDEMTTLYTYANGQTHEIGEFSSRNCILLDGSGNIYNISSSGAFNTVFAIMRISNDGTSLDTTEAWEINGSTFTHTSSGGVEVISEGDFITVADRFYGMTAEFVDSLDWQSLSSTPGATILTPDEAAWFLYDWLEFNSFSLATTDEILEEVDIDGTMYYISGVYYNSEYSSDNFLVYINAVTGELLAPGDGEDFNLMPLDTWYDVYGDYLYQDYTDSESSSDVNDMASADGYIISSGSTVYAKGGGMSLFGSVTEAVVDIKTDGSATITWVAVLENMGLYGWQRSELYPDGNTLLNRLLFWSPTLKKDVGFYPPENVSLDQLYSDLNNITW